MPDKIQRIERPKSKKAVTGQALHDSTTKNYRYKYSTKSDGDVVKDTEDQMEKESYRDKKSEYDQMKKRKKRKASAELARSKKAADELEYSTPGRKHQTAIYRTSFSDPKNKARIEKQDKEYAVKRITNMNKPLIAKKSRQKALKKAYGVK